METNKLKKIDDQFLFSYLIEDLSHNFKKFEEGDLKELEGLFNLWNQNLKKLAEPDLCKERIELFNSLLDLCEKIYSLLTKYFCGEFKLKSPIKYNGIEIATLSVLLEPGKYIKILKNEQSFSFKTSSYKRDNIVHQFRVFLLGYYLLSNQKLREWIWEDLKDFFGMAKYPLEENDDIIFDIILSIWSLASLFHDMGRGIETFYKFLANLKKDFKLIFDLFGLSLPVQNVKFQLNDSWETKKKTFLKLFDFFCKERMGDFYNVLKEKIEELLDKPSHGIISALLITFPGIEIVLKDWKNFPLAEKIQKETYDNPEEDFLKAEQLIKMVSSDVDIHKSFNDFLQIVPKIVPSFYAALAVALHDVLDCWFATRLTAFLILCDNLQEWQRLTKLGDQYIMIFPCKEVKLGFDGDSQDLRYINISYHPPDFLPKDLSKITDNDICIIHEFLIYLRWHPKKKWTEFKEAINKNQTEKIKLYEPCFEEPINFSIEWKNNNDPYQPREADKGIQNSKIQINFNF